LVPCPTYYDRPDIQSEPCRLRVYFSCPYSIQRRVKIAFGGTGTGDGAFAIKIGQPLLGLPSRRHRRLKFALINYLCFATIVLPEVEHVLDPSAQYPVTDFPARLHSDWDVVVHMVAMGQVDADAAVRTFQGRTQRLVMISSATFIGPMGA